MTTTYSNAIDEINAEFWNSWNSDKTVFIVGYVPDVRWQGVEEPSLPDGSKFWARVSIQTVFEEQTSLAGNESKKRYTSSGLVFVQIFCPKSNAQANEFGKKLSEVARNAFRGKSTAGAVWFRNVRINELSPEDLFYRFNVVAEFEYDEIANKEPESGFIPVSPEPPVYFVDGGTFN